MGFEVSDSGNSNRYQLIEHDNLATNCVSIFQVEPSCAE